MRFASSPTFVDCAATTLCLALVSTLSLHFGITLAPQPIAELFPFTPLGLPAAFSAEHLTWTTTCAAPSGQATLGYLQLFLVTCAIEAPFYWAALPGLSATRRLALLVAANLLTHPIVYFLLPCAFERYVPALLVSESFAPAAEMALLIVLNKRLGWNIPPARIAALLLLANLASWQLGIYV